MKKLTGLTIFFPCYNEEANVENTVRDALRVAPQVAETYEVIAVDDGSKDHTADIVRRLTQSDHHVRLVAHEKNKGYGEALKSGFRSARQPWVFYTDGDGQFEMNELPAMAAKASEGTIVSGYRVARADSWHRKLNADIFALALRVFMGLKVRDVDCAFKLYPSALFNKITMNTSGALIDAEILVKAIKAGYTIVPMPVTHKPRRAGHQTGAKLRVILKAMKEFLMLWSDLHAFSIKTSRK